MKTRSPRQSLSSSSVHICARRLRKGQWEEKCLEKRGKRLHHKFCSRSQAVGEGQKGTPGRGLARNMLRQFTRCRDDSATCHDIFWRVCNIAVSLTEFVCLSCEENPSKMPQDIINVTTMSDSFKAIQDKVRQDFGHPHFGVPFDFHRGSQSYKICSFPNGLSPNRIEWSVHAVSHHQDSLGRHVCRTTLPPINF